MGWPTDTGRIESERGTGWLAAMAAGVVLSHNRRDHRTRVTDVVVDGLSQDLDDDGRAAALAAVGSLHDTSSQANTAHQPSQA
jgi:hypothetical protein